MPDRSLGPRSRAGAARVERRAPRGRPGSLSWLRSLLGRPVVLEPRNGQLHLALQERRRPPELIEALERAALCDELRRRLMRHGKRHVVVLRPLVAVQDALSREGWDRVGRLPAVLLGKAHEQLTMLLGREGSPTLSDLAGRLRLLQAAAEVREDRARRDGLAEVEEFVVVENVEVREIERDDRAWVVTESPAHLPPR